jgi:mRNA-degrading endonuclease toxin of MazEF toxin-antitoxin module
VSFPYIIEDQTLVKRRPAVIVSNDYNNGRLDDVLLVPLTSNTSRMHTDPHRVVVRANSPEGKAGGLRLDSVIDCTVIATIPKTLLVAKIGQFPEETMQRIDNCLRRSIGGPEDDDSLGCGVLRKPSPSHDDTGGAAEPPKPDPEPDQEDP